MRCRMVPFLFAQLVVLTLTGYAQNSPSLPLSSLRLPAGFSIAVYSSGVPDARELTLGSNGTVFVGTRSNEVYALLDVNKDNAAEKVVKIALGLDMPNGVAFRDGALYVAESRRILRYDNIERNIDRPPEPQVVSDRFPSQKDHGWKFIAFGPDGLLYVPVGAPCNVCESDDPRSATIMRMKPDGSDPEIFASGIRNTVGFDWHPRTRELWFTDNGRDLMGDNQPPDELNRAQKKGMNFGFPYFHGFGIPDPRYADGRKPADFAEPVLALGPHVAALGMRFYTGAMFPKEYRGGIFIAEHGSWNRTVPIGYRVTFVTLEGNRATGYRVFAEGWLGKDGKAWGRPVDVLVMPDGALLVSDDRSGTVYRIAYTGGSHGK